MIERSFAHSSEEDLVNNYPNVYLPFIANIQNGNLDVGDNTQIHYRYALPDDAKAVILVMPGRSESVVKYAELCYQLVHSGYGILIYDHRGQGMSTRPKSNSQIGHVDDFNDYLNDVEIIVETLIARLFPSQLPLHLLAHSMGGAIGAGAIIRMPTVFKSAVLCAPMLGIKAPIPAALASVIAKLGLLKENLTGASPSFFVGQSEFKPTDFGDNQLSSSKVRYGFFMKTHGEDVTLQLGGISNKWLIEALKLMQFVSDNANKIDVPITILRAMEEQIVDNAAIQRFSGSAKSCNLIDIDGARHEILFERDAMRDLALDHIFHLFNEYSK